MQWCASYSLTTCRRQEGGEVVDFGVLKEIHFRETWYLLTFVLKS